MLRNLLLLPVLLATLCGGPVHAGSDLKPWTGGPTPQLALRDLAGREVRLADFRGKVVVVNFWATWCAPCIEEMPSMQRLQEKLGPAGLEILAVWAIPLPTRSPDISRCAISSGPISGSVTARCTSA